MKGTAMATALPVIHRYEIPVDDQWHYLNLPRGLQHVACRRSATVEVWAYAASPGDAPSWRQFRVYGTGHPMPIASVHIATAIRPGGDLVWHLIENACTHRLARPGTRRPGAAGVVRDVRGASGCRGGLHPQRVEDGLMGDTECPPPSPVAGTRCPDQLFPDRPLLCG
jgi:hypothetical protein